MADIQREAERIAHRADYSQIRIAWTELLDPTTWRVHMKATSAGKDELICAHITRRAQGLSGGLEQASISAIWSASRQTVPEE